jgi:hypothetical protein
MTLNRSLIVATAVVVLALACQTSRPIPIGPASPLQVGQVLATDATVRFVDMEGGCWALDTPQGRYEPLELPTAYKRDGLAVAVVLRGPAGGATICQMAPLALVDSIRTR